MNKFWGNEKRYFGKVDFNLSDKGVKVSLGITVGGPNDDVYQSNLVSYTQSREFDGATLAKMHNKEFPDKSKKTFLTGLTLGNGKAYVASNASIGRSDTTLSSLIGAAKSAMIHEFGNQFAKVNGSLGDPKKKYKTHPDSDSGITFEECVNNTLRDKKWLSENPGKR
jgi:hypothetical protein